MQLHLCLSGKAARAVHTEDGIRQSYQEMVTRSKRHFDVTGQEIRNELRIRKRRNNESIQDVADAIITLLESA